MAELLRFRVYGDPKGRVHTRAMLVSRTRCPRCRRAEGQVPLNDQLARCTRCACVYRAKITLTGGKANPEQLNWFAAVKGAAVGAAGEQGWEKQERGAIRLGVEFIVPRPQAYLWKGPHKEPRCWRGLDLGNLTKALEDCLNGVLWRDDAQISEYGPTFLRRYAYPGEECGAVVRVEALGEWDEELDALSAVGAAAVARRREEPELL